MSVLFYRFSCVVLRFQWSFERINCSDATARVNPRAGRARLGRARITFNFALNFRLEFKFNFALKFKFNIEAKFNLKILTLQLRITITVLSQNSP